jgi:hypothetical protein
VCSAQRETLATGDSIGQAPEREQRAITLGNDEYAVAAILSIRARVSGTEPSTWEHKSLVQIWGPRRSVERARTLELWLGDVRRAFDDRLLDVDRDIADEWGHMNGLRNVATIDGLLAATAKVRRMTLVTRNSTDVEGLGADVLNPFEAARR